MQPLLLAAPRRPQQFQYASSNRRRSLSLLRPWHLAAALVLSALAALCWVELSAFGALPSITAGSRSTYAALSEQGTDTETQSAVDDLLVQEVVRQCMQQQDTLIWLHATKTTTPAAVSVHSSKAPGRQWQDTCALFHIPLASADRSIGLCTDAALYMQLLGGWIVPASATTPLGMSHAQRCGHKSAVLFLEPLYEPWLSWLEQQQHVVALYAPNFEQVFGYDAAAHGRMHLILCKVRRCEELMRRYLDDIHSSARIMYTGHTSVDPQALLRTQQSTLSTSLGGAVKRPMMLPTTPSALRHQQQQQQQPPPVAIATSTAHQNTPPLAAAAAPPLSVLHVRGKSGLKHTKQLLDCWVQHPEWPHLTVVGPMPNEQISGAEAKRFMAAPNIHVPKPGKHQGPNWPEFEPLSAGELALLLMSHAVHVMPSEREGFGHSINEGRAAGAVLLVPDHPPMNELVREGSGLLLSPHATFSHTDPPVPVLGKYGNISVSMSAEGICRGVSQVLAKSPAELAAMGARARGLFESDRAAFVDSLRDVLGELQALLQVAEVADGGGIMMTQGTAQRGA